MEMHKSTTINKKYDGKLHRTSDMQNNGHTTFHPPDRVAAYARMACAERRRADTGCRMWGGAS